MNGLSKIMRKVMDPVNPVAHLLFLLMAVGTTWCVVFPMLTVFNLNAALAAKICSSMYLGLIAGRLWVYFGTVSCALVATVIGAVDPQSGLLFAGLTIPMSIIGTLSRVTVRN